MTVHVLRFKCLPDLTDHSSKCQLISILNHKTLTQRYPKESHLPNPHKDTENMIPEHKAIYYISVSSEYYWKKTTVLISRVVLLKLCCIQ